MTHRSNINGSNHVLVAELQGRFLQCIYATNGQESISPSITNTYVIFTFISTHLFVNSRDVPVVLPRFQLVFFVWFHSKSQIQAMPASNVPVSATYFHASETRIFVLFLRHFCIRLSRFHSSLSKNIVNLPRTHACTRTRHYYLTVLQSCIPKLYPTFFKSRGEHTDITATFLSNCLQQPS